LPTATWQSEEKEKRVHSFPWFEDALRAWGIRREIPCLRLFVARIGHLSFQGQCIHASEVEESHLGESQGNFPHIRSVEFKQHPGRRNPVNFKNSGARIFDDLLCGLELGRGRIRLNKKLSVVLIGLDIGIGFSFHFMTGGNIRRCMFFHGWFLMNQPGSMHFSCPGFLGKDRIPISGRGCSVTHEITRENGLKQAVGAEPRGKWDRLSAELSCSGARKKMLKEVIESTR
jgi:hypothetical protein